MVSSILRAFAAFAHEPRNDSAQKCSERRAGGIYEHIGDKAGAPGDKILNDLVRDRGEGADGKRNGKARDGGTAAGAGKRSARKAARSR